ncbi:MaoC family dehydratase [Nakamurella sp. YIM 132087]|uniref:MaoC family dehydratase n=1 Tax=Nakamurella alba TaxID=2665158 RepID=A0A7K1FRW9_9ACTN|nr:MaoC family dehydratase [Nakamurella alba]MTD15983.1 MaoC family dehydratase [Nakamurella alba]
MTAGLVLTGRDELFARVGTELGTSDWISITQQDVNTFADLTGDHQWIHVDVERATASRFGGTIVHGYLTLSMVSQLQLSMFDIQGFGYGLNYGLDRVRFPSPLPTGSRVRLTVELTEVTDVPGDGVQILLTNTFHREGGDKPVCVAQSLIRYYP